MYACGSPPVQGVCSDSTCVDASTCDGPNGCAEPGPRSCAAHDDCLQSGVCLREEHVCAAVSDVVYVAGQDVDPPGIDNATCPREAPCAKFAPALATRRPYLLARGAIDDTVTIDDARHLSVFAAKNAKLTHTGSGDPVLTVNHDGAVVKIYDLEFSGVTNSETDTIYLQSGSLAMTGVLIIDNAGLGIRAVKGSLEVRQSKLVRNAGGGILVRDAATFQIVDNLIHANGGAEAEQGGIRIRTMEASINQLDYNTFVGNVFKRDVGAAIQCTAGEFVARNNLLCDNGMTKQRSQVDGCRYAYHEVWPDTEPPGTGNFVGDPKFVDPGNDFHPAAGSPAIGHADPGTDPKRPAIDLDGTSRPHPATVGAYEPIP